MKANINTLNYTITIKFSGTVLDFDGQKCYYELEVPSNLNERVSDLISRFFQISGLNSENYRFYFGGENLEKYKSHGLFQIGLKNNSKIELAYVELEVFRNDNDNLGNFDDENNFEFNQRIYIKFIKFSTYSSYNYNKELKGILKLCLLNEIASKIELPNLQIWKMSGYPEIAYFILKILKYSYDYQYGNDKPSENIEEVLKKEKGCNVINFSNFVDEEINTVLLQNIMNLLQKKDFADINDTKCRLGKYDKYMDFFEKNLNKIMKKNVFEFSIVSLVVLDRQDYDTFEQERNKCPHRCEQILFHGTQIHPISLILTGLFKKSEVKFYQNGKGVYFTDSLDYCWFYGGKEDIKDNKDNKDIKANRANMNKIPKIGDTFTAITSMVYYNKEGFLQVQNYHDRVQPGKNEVNFAYAASTSETILNPDPKKFYGTEYVIWDLNQICPFISVKFKRDEFCVIWRDDNFSEGAVYNDKFDAIFKQFLKERLKYIKQSAKYNVYPCITTEEALKLVNRKKYNKIILISNVRPDYEGRKFIDQARQIIGSNVIALFLCYAGAHLKWIKDYKNGLYANEKVFYEEYLDNFGSESKMRELISKMENHYNVKFNIDNDFLKFPHFRQEGFYSDLTF